MDMRWIVIAAALPLAACAAMDAPGDDMGPPPPADAVCNADAAADHVGQTATPDRGAAILRDSGARTLRWGPPRSAMTMDYRQDRVNVIYDDAYKITEINCG